MLASEACPTCGTRVEGKPTPALESTRSAPRGGPSHAWTPRWGFECVTCEHAWIAEPISDSLNLGAPRLEIRVYDSRRRHTDRPFQNVDDFYPARRWPVLELGWLATLGGLLISR
jgi:hypothetical protein